MPRGKLSSPHSFCPHRRVGLISKTHLSAFSVFTIHRTSCPRVSNFTVSSLNGGSIPNLIQGSPSSAGHEGWQGDGGGAWKPEWPQASIFLMATLRQGLGPSRVPQPQCNPSKSWVYAPKQKQRCVRKPGTQLQHKRVGRHGCKIRQQRESFCKDQQT